MSKRPSTLNRDIGVTEELLDETYLNSSFPSALKTNTYILSFLDTSLYVLHIIISLQFAVTHSAHTLLTNCKFNLL